MDGYVSILFWEGDLKTIIITSLLHTGTIVRFILMFTHLPKKLR